MADHDELVAEMPVLETMGTQERQKLAKKRRLQQLKRWSQREKEWIAKEKQLNKRLANIMSEENNGLNLKQYTTYNSNQRTKKRLINSNNVTRNGKNDQTSQSAPVSNGINRKEFNNNSTINGPYSNCLEPSGRVHFNVGVMLLEAAARNDYDEVKRLLSLGVSPDSVNHDGLTALHQCCIDASEPIMQLLLDYGANVDARDTEQWTPLHAACTCGHLNLVKKLVEHNADLLAVNGDGNMPFDICEDEATLDYIESQMVKQGITQEMIDLTRASSELHMLEEIEKVASTNKADLSQGDEQGVTRLHVAATNNYVSAVKLLINHGVNVNVCDNDLWTPLHGVACWGNEQHLEIVESLVEAGASLDSKTLSDETVFDLCDNVELLERLNQLKDELESKQATGNGRLRRTQSRTNSRVHSVRRTSVRDKNQISRREAREEAMLRVDSNSETPADPSTNVDGQIAPVAREASDHNGVLDSLPLRQQDDAQVEPDNDQPDPRPIVTNLDEPNELELESSSGVTNEHSATRSQSIIEQTTNDLSKKTSNDSAHAAIDRPRVTGAILLDATETIGSAKSSTPLKLHVAPPTTKHNDSSRQPASKDNDLLITKSISYQATDPPKTSIDGIQRQLSTTVQVQFGPTNYTLANLKKHRSDLRMRSCSIGGNTSTISLNSAEGTSSENFIGQQVNEHLSNDQSLPISIRETVRLEPELERGLGTPNSKALTLRSNGSVTRNESPSLNIRKFHGEPSDLFSGGSGRKLRPRCCVII